MSEIRDIFERVTQRSSIPVRIGSRCESNVFYRVENLTESDVSVCSSYVADRVDKVCTPSSPEILIQLPGSFSGLAELLSQKLSLTDEPLEILTLDRLVPGNGVSKRLKNTPVALVNDVITTARSCIEAHTRVTMMGASVMCWLALIDRTFGPGPVPVIAAFTGEPVTLLEKIS
jgi:hypothetical protein